MRGQAWQDFAAEVAAWRDAGQAVEFWWRDDDATRPASALTRLFRLASGNRVPLALAVVPEGAQAEAFAELGSEVSVIQHGVDHVSRAASGEKKTEFPVSEPVGWAVGRLIRGREKLEGVAGDRFIPVLAPPWNRLSDGLMPHLAEAGFRGFSTFGVRKVTNPAPGVLAVNTHVDIVDWKGSRGFAGVDQVLAQAIRHLKARRTGGADAGEPTGWLTHHAVHDEECWTFLDNLFEFTRSTDTICWRSPAGLFMGGSGN